MKGSEKNSKLLQRYHELVLKSNDISAKSQFARKNTPQKRSNRRKWKKPKDKPKRPLSAYNLFFRDERERLKHGKLYDAEDGTKNGFAGLFTHVANEWKKVDQEARKSYESKAHLEQIRYKEEMDVWLMGQECAAPVVSKIRKPDQLLSAKVSSKKYEDQPKQATQPVCIQEKVTVDIVRYDDKTNKPSESLQKSNVTRKSDAVTQSRQKCTDQPVIELKDNLNQTVPLFKSSIQKQTKTKAGYDEIDRIVKLCKTQSYQRNIQQHGSPLQNSKQVPTVQKVSPNVNTATAALQLMNYQYLQQQQNLLLLENARQQRNIVQHEVTRLLDQVQNLQQLSLVTDLVFGAKRSKTPQNKI